MCETYETYEKRNSKAISISVNREIINNCLTDELM